MFCVFLSSKLGQGLPVFVRPSRNQLFVSSTFPITPISDTIELEVSEKFSEPVYAGVVPLMPEGHASYSVVQQCLCSAVQCLCSAIQCLCSVVRCLCIAAQCGRGATFGFKRFLTMRHSSSKELTAQYRYITVPSYGWVSPLSTPPVPKKNQLPKLGTQNRTKLPMSSILGEIGFVFLGLEQNNNFVGRGNPYCPGRLNTLH